MGEDIYNLKNFEDILYDSVHMLYLAHDIEEEKDHDGYEWTYVRCSILNTVLLFECAANCCVSSLNLPRKFAEDLDKLPFLSKYEYFLSRINPDTKFDRGCKELQCVAELKQVRDAYVHPKVRKALFKEIDEFTRDVEFGETPLLKIPRNPREWGKSSAVRALKCANDFFNLYFLTWAKLDSNSVCAIVLGSEEVEIPAQTGYFVDGVGGLTRASKQWGIDFRFIGKKQA